MPIYQINLNKMDESEIIYLDQKYSKIRRDYEFKDADTDSLGEDPYVEFCKALDYAHQQNISEFNAFCLATTNNQNEPSTRILLLKAMQENKLIFFTNYQSSKAQDLSKNQNVAVNFFWQKLERQIRIKGIASKVDSAISDYYFNSRPHEAQVSAVLSRQSKPLSDRPAFLADIAEHKDQTQKVSRPEYWGGYQIEVQSYEFWFGRKSRIHERFLYQRDSAGCWQKKSLYP